MLIDKSSPSFVAITCAKELGAALKKRRSALRLTQPELALAAGCGLRFIVELEAGKPTVRLENVLRVIHVLGLNLQMTTQEARQTELSQE